MERISTLTSYQKHFKHLKLVRSEHRLVVPPPLSFWRETLFQHNITLLNMAACFTQREYYYGNVRPDTDAQARQTASQMDWTHTFTGAPTNRDLKRWGSALL
jgi:hypothetical protein